MHVAAKIFYRSNNIKNIKIVKYKSRRKTNFLVEMCFHKLSPEHNIITYARKNWNVSNVNKFTPFILINFISDKVLKFGHICKRHIIETNGNIFAVEVSFKFMIFVYGTLISVLNA